MKKIVYVSGVALFLLSMACHADMPEWLESPTHPSYQHAQSYCSPIEGAVYEARLVAGAKVRGAIAQALDNHVTATSTLSKRSIESESGDAVLEQLTEQIEVKSSYQLAGFKVISQDIYSINGIKHFCIWGGIAKDI